MVSSRCYPTLLRYRSTDFHAGFKSAADYPSGVCNDLVGEITDASDFKTTARPRQHATIANLTTAFGIKRRALKHY